MKNDKANDSDDEYYFHMEDPNGNVRTFAYLDRDATDDNVPNRLVKKHCWKGETYYYDGPCYKEALKKIEWKSGKVWHFDGPVGKERLVRIEWPNGTIQHYEGVHGKEILVKGFKNIVHASWPNVAYRRALVFTCAFVITASMIRFAQR